MPAGPTSSAGDAPRPPRAALYLIPAAVLGLCWLLRNGIALNHDVAWLLVAARRMVEGGTYSADFFEVNMPLAIAVYVPALGLAAASGLALAPANTLWITMLVAQSLLLIAAIGRGSRDPVASTISSPAGLSVLAVALHLFPAEDFGQREHLVAVLGLPLLLLLALDAPPPSRLLRGYTGLVGAVGFLIKPHFAPLPLLLLALRAGRQRSLAPLRSAEGLGFVLCALAYAAIVTFAFPDWFACARWAQDLYGGYRRDSLEGIAGIDSLPSCLLLTGLLAAALPFAEPAKRPALRVFFLATAYAWLVYLLQFKGWRYQFLPAALFAFALAVLLWPAAAARSGSPTRTRITAAVVALAAMVLATDSVLALRGSARESQMSRSTIGLALAAARPGDTVYIFSTAVAPAFPTVVLMHLDWGSRYAALWPLAGIAEALQSTDRRERLKLARYAQPLTDAVNADFERHHPAIVLVDRRPTQFGLPPGFDILGFFLHDPAFGRTWSNYEMIGKSSDFDIYRDRRLAREPLPASWAAPP